MAKKTSKAKKETASAAPSENGTVEKQRNRSEMYYAVVGIDPKTGQPVILAKEETVGRIRKLWHKMAPTFRLVAAEVKLVRIVVVPFERPIDEEEGHDEVAE